MAKCKYTRGKKGYFETRAWDGSYDEFGRKRYIYLRSKKSSADLERKVSELKRAVEERKFVRQSEVTFFEYAKRWKDVYKSSKSKNTMAMYDNIVLKHIIALEGVKLQDISRIHYQVLINNATGKARTQQQIKMTFNQILKSAVADQLLPANIVDDIFNNIDTIYYSATEKRPLTATEKEAVFKADFSPSDRAFVHILYGCGLRRGEALALTRFDIDLKRNILSIRRALAFDGNEPYIKTTKSTNGVRIVPIPQKIQPELYEYVSTLKSERLFTMSKGRWRTKSSYRKMWERIIRKMQEVSEEDIVGLTAHIFRHNYCTNLCYQIPTISIQKIAELLGDTEKMVLEVYNHMISEKEDAVSAVEKALNF